MPPPISTGAVGPNRALPMAAVTPAATAAGLGEELQRAEHLAGDTTPGAVGGQNRQADHAEGEARAEQQPYGDEGGQGVGDAVAYQAEGDQREADGQAEPGASVQHSVHRHGRDQVTEVRQGEEQTKEGGGGPGEAFLDEGDQVGEGDDRGEHEGELQRVEPAQRGLGGGGGGLRPLLFRLSGLGRFGQGGEQQGGGEREQREEGVLAVRGHPR